MKASEEKPARLTARRGARLARPARHTMQLDRERVEAFRDPAWRGREQEEDCSCYEELATIAEILWRRKIKQLAKGRTGIAHSTVSSAVYKSVCCEGAEGDCVFGKAGVLALVVSGGSSYLRASASASARLMC
eukprot:scaffold9287_cov126-Isochrysis_galbana.AAC.5